MDLIRKYLKSEKKLDMLWFILFPILNVNYIISGRIYESGYSIMLPQEENIPLIAIFIIPYVYWYLYMALGYLIINIKDRRRFMKSMLSLFTGMICCYLIYYIFPTQYNRPLLNNENVLNKMINVIYGADKPFNCFPSLHVLGTYFIMRYTKLKDGKVLFLYTQIVGILIILSTVFIKQHFILDIFASILLVELIIYLYRNISDKNLDNILNYPNKLIQYLKIRK